MGGCVMENALSEKQKTILIIDDDADCCLYLKQGLAFQGYNILVTTSGKSGLKMLAEIPCDAVLLDIFLPDTESIDLAQRIRKEKGKFFPIIGFTGTSIESLQEQFSDKLECFSKIFIKPFDYQSLIQVLQNNQKLVFNEEEDSFQSLIRAYQTSIPDRLELLQGLFEDMKKKPNESTLKALRLQIHKLAGNAGLYGYDEVSKICKEFDEVLGKDIILFQQNANTKDWIEEFNSYMEKIKKSFKDYKESNIVELEQKILDKKAIIGVIGLGNIGLSLLDAFGRAGFSLVGFDIDATKVQMLQNKESYLNYFDMTPLFAMLEQKRFKPSSDPQVLENADVLIISVPTSIDAYGTPNFSNLRQAFQTVATYLKKQQLIILQSSTYPGTTREELLPILLKSNLNVGIDFFLAHVPEIADIGNEHFNFMQMSRIVSGVTPSCLKKVSLLYENISAKVIPCTSTDVAEAAKLLQNAFRLINISFINEMKMLFDTMNIDVWEVITAAATKPFGFMPFYPSAGIGGDCIPIAPMYLVWKAKSTDGPTTMLEDAARINEKMAYYVINKLVYGLNTRKKTIRDAKILVLGVTYKKDVNDIRESAALKIIHILKTMMADVYYHDPFIKVLDNFSDHPGLIMESIHFDYKTLNSFDGILVVTDHSCYDWHKLIEHSNLLIDTRNISDKLMDTRKIIKA
jgi:UDP-N-acetyl-D-glucosamine dehydrogenase